MVADRAGDSDATPLLVIDPLVDVKSLTDEAASHSHLMSRSQATIALIKGIAGAGLFALPFAVQQAGLVAAVVSLVALAWLSADTIKLLVAVKTRVFGAAPATYLDIGVRVLGEDAARLISVAVLACSIGVATAYLDFIRCMGASLLPVIAQRFSSAVFLLPALPIIAALCLVRSYRVLAFTALIGDVSIFAGIFCVVIYGLLHSDQHRALSSFFNADSSSSWFLSLVIEPRSYPSFLSTAAFLFCVHFFILPISSNMHRPQQFAASVNQSFTITAIVNVLFGVIGWLCFAAPSAVILNNIANGAWIVAIKALLCLDMVFSYAVVFYPGREIVEAAVVGECDHKNELAYHSPSPTHRAQLAPAASTSPTATFPSLTDSRSHSERRNHFATDAVTGTVTPPSFFRLFRRLSVDGQRATVRLSLIGLTVFLALCLPMFNVVIGLVGGVSMTALGFIFPPLFALRLRRQKMVNVHASHARHHHDNNHFSSSFTAAAAEEWNDASQLTGSWRPLYWYAIIAFGVLIILLTLAQSTRAIIEAINSDAPLRSC